MLVLCDFPYNRHCVSNLYVVRFNVQIIAGVLTSGWIAMSCILNRDEWCLCINVFSSGLIRTVLWGFRQRSLKLYLRSGCRCRMRSYYDSTFQLDFNCTDYNWLAEDPYIKRNTHKTYACTCHKNCHYDFSFRLKYLSYYLWLFNWRAIPKAGHSENMRLHMP